MESMNASSIDLFSRLSTCLAGLVLSDWIDLTDLAKMDSAFCYRANRGSLLNLIKSEECANRDYPYQGHADVLRWVILRDVKLTLGICRSVSECEMLAEYCDKDEIAEAARCLELQCLTSLPCKCLTSLSCKELLEPACELITNNLDFIIYSASLCDNSTP